jgi:hypothetical protein
VGVDAALNFPLFFKLPAAAKGQLAPAEVIAMFEHRKQVERDVISSHDEASRYRARAAWLRRSGRGSARSLVG